MISRRSALAAGLAVLAPSVRAAARLPVVASFSILADLVREVGGNSVMVQSLVPAGVDIHRYRPAPSEMRGVTEAAVFVINGLGLEGWAERVAQAAGFKGTGVVASRGVPALPGGHKHEEHQGEGGHSHGAHDPHAWQDVANTRTYVENIRNGLIAADAAGAAGYRTQADAYLARLGTLDRDIRGILAPIPRASRRVITSHEAFNYYGDAYDVDFLAPVISTEQEPSARAFASLIAQIRREGIRAMFLEQGASPRLLEQIARETGVKIGGTLYPDTLTPPGGPASSYIEMMLTNTRRIAAALA
ncbi:MAG: metal ABC transporter solute-binding protein, Zn/Mn family [Acetobacteraceae bacterium]